jgi:hypothetical protein
MLDKLGEWYRIVSPNPRHEDLEMRKKSVAALVPTFKKNKDLTLEAVSGVVWRFDPGMNVIPVLTEAIQAEDLRFSTALGENELELRIVAALSLGEIMSSPRVSKARRIAAAFIKSALGIPREVHSQNRHLAKMVQALQSLAVDVLDQEADAIRKVSPIHAQQVDIAGQFQTMEQAAQNNTVPNQPLQLWLAVSPILHETMKTLLEQINALESTQRVDREELDVLWWSYSSRSRTTGNPFAEMSLGATVLCAGCELADICPIPPLPNARHLLADVVARGRKGTSQKIPLGNVVSEWDEQILVSTVQDNSGDVEEIVKKYPTLLPISWITQRLVESKMTASWADEFELLTGIKNSTSLRAAQWAAQVFWEQVAQKVYVA